MLNKLLQRQVQQHLGGSQNVPVHCGPFLQIISDSYDSYETDRKLLERSSDLSSQEMVDLNGKLRKEADEVQRAHSELHRILDNINEAFFSLHMSTFQYVFISLACEKIYGYSREEFLANPMLWKEVIHPDDTHMANIDDERLVCGERLAYQYRITHKDQSIRWLDVKIIPSLEGGQLVRLDAVINDITEQKNAQIQLEKANDELSLLFNTIEDVLFSVDMRTYKVIQMSSACETVYGYTFADFSSDGDLWNRIIHPDDRYLLEDHFTKLNAGEKVKNQYRIIHKDQSIRWIENSIVPTIDDEGHLIRIDGVTRDITEKKITEQKIAQSEKQYRDLFENNPMPMWVLDIASFRFLDVNEAAIRDYGYSRKEFLSMTALDIKPEEEKERFLEVARSHFSGSYSTQTSLLKKDGSVICVEMKANEIVFEGKLARLVLSNDITEKKIAEQNLENANLELNNLFNTIDEVIYSIDMASGKIVRMSPACKKVYGYTPEDFYADPELWYKITHPLDMGQIVEYGPRLIAGEQVIGQCRIINKNGEMRWMEFNVIPCLDKNGILERIDGVARDITGKKLSEELLKQSEEGYRLICSNPMLGVIWASPDGILTKVNEAFANMLGYTVDEITGMHFAEFTHPDDLQRDGAVTSQLFRGEISNFRCEKRYITKNKKILWGELNLNSIKDDQGGVQYSIGVIQDISARKQAETELLASHGSLEIKVKERTVELEASNNELEAFGYSISHDLRAPLRIINGYGQLLINDCGDKLNEEEKDSLQVIMTNAAHMGQLIDDLLNFSRLGRSSFEKRSVNMNDMTRVVIEEFKTENKCLPKITLHDMPYADCDPNLTKQVWVNLISNAIKYSGKSSAPHIEIGTNGHNGSLVYYVKDNGAGFDMQYADKLFGVFQRLHNVADYEGTGVGLALTHRIITRQGGKIWAEAKVNEGATFYFTLPGSKSSN
ncbi:MAG: sensory box histidine kinase [Bacteroidetes bacterium]|nr:sensory box histidine kinase [Bacteroidota bacterium]